MRLITVGFIIGFSALTTAAMADTTKNMIADAIGQITYLSQACGTYKINENKLTEVLANAGLTMADLEDGDYKAPYLFAIALASEIAADMSMAGTCYHLKNRFGAEGYTVVDLVVPK